MRFNAIGNGRFSALLTRMLWVKSADAAAPSLADEITPVLAVNDVNDLAAPFLRGERWATAYAAVSAPGAGNYAKVRLVNPPDSGLLVICHEFAFFTNTAGEIFGEMAGIAGPGNPAAGRLITDSRWWGTSAIIPAANAQIASDTIAPGSAVNTPYYQQVGASSARVSRSCQIVLSPGTQFVIGHSVIATPSLICDFAWRERPVAREELQTG